MKSPAQAGDFFIYAMTEFFNYNGKLFQLGENFISPDSRAFRYGDGLFETMIVKNKTIRLASLHFERLFNGLKILKFGIPKLFEATALHKAVLDLCKKNNHSNARVRLAVFRGDGGLYDLENLQPNFVIQSWALPQQVMQLNENGLVIDVYPHAQKAMDVFANIKSANYLPYVMAALYAKENKLNDSLVLNAAGRIADSTIANLFFFKEDVLYTPALGEGCVAGVMRRFIIANSTAIGYNVIESAVTIEALKEADEIFLTNAAYGLRWINQFRDKEFTNDRTKIICQKLIKAIESPQLFP